MPQLRTDEQGTLRVYQFPVRIEYPARENHRAYLSHPPLEHGYSPLAQYLDRDVPPNNFLRINVNLTLREVAQPLVLQKGVFFNVAEWERSADGMRATMSNASLVVDPNAFSDEARANATWGLRVVFDGPDPPALTVVAGAERRPGVVLLQRDLGNGRTLAAYYLENLRIDKFEVPAGMTLRGIYLDAWGV